jgi:hypothetical protein
MINLFSYSFFTWTLGPHIYLVFLLLLWLLLLFFCWLLSMFKPLNVGLSQRQILGLLALFVNLYLLQC